MITDGEKRQYLAVTNLSALLAKKSSVHDGDFYCLNCFNSYTSKNKLKEHEEVCNNHKSCRVEMPKWVEKILKYYRSLKAPFTIYLDLEQSCKNNPEKLYTEKKTKHGLSRWAMFTKFSFDEKENKLDYCRREDCIEKLYKKLKKACNENNQL